MSTDQQKKTIKYSDAIKTVTEELMADGKTVVIGQGVTDFKRLWGTLPKVNPENVDRIIETPLCEDAAAGISLGLALNGFYPINTHIRADFSLLAFNQIINMGAKYKYMFGGLFSMPSMFRLVVGRSWGQGAQHSQSFHGMLGHIPGLKVLVPTTAADVFDVYRHARYKLDCPTVVFEHRLLYDLNFTYDPTAREFSGSKVERIGQDLTIVATSLMVVEAMRVADEFAKKGVFVEVINVVDITHPDRGLIAKSVQKTGLMIVADISWQQYGFASEINSIVSQLCFGSLLAAPKVVGKPFAPCPTAKSLEDEYHPSYADLLNAATSLLSCKSHLPKLHLIEKSSSTDFYKHFKGPF